MCGIVGIITKSTNCFSALLYGLQQLQNRGYDSAGICTINSSEFILNKYVSNDISALIKLEKDANKHIQSTIGIAHTRWATHGSKTIYNSHPHKSSDNKFVVVHNGIIENFDILKQMLIQKGYIFSSETDTEVICNLLAYNYTINNMNIINAIQATTCMLQGTWAVCILCIDFIDTLYCTKKDSPILIGQDNTCVMVVSEQSGFCNNIDKYIVLQNNDICSISLIANNLNIQTTYQYNLQKITTLNELSLPIPYIHWTLKEIYEQELSCLRTIGDLSNKVKVEVEVKELDLYDEQLMQIDNLIILGCGTSYNAGMASITYFKELCNFNYVQIIDGADFSITDIPTYGRTALLLLSQSGETKDLHRCILIAKTNNIFTIGIVNVVNSLIAREVDCVCYLNAGREVAVASTKSFTSQCMLLSIVAIWFSQKRNINGIQRQQYIHDLQCLPLHIAELFTTLEKNVCCVLPLFDNQSSCFILGKGACEYIAHEGALKIKEISYIHSEGYSSSSLKHGPFALLCKDFPVILIMPNDEHYTKNINTYHEIQSREANILIITNKVSPEDNVYKNVLYIPYNKTYNNILSVIPLQMIAYKLSINKGINPDFPKNLAKVVTVE
jgi:glucosamine--fructose-6-phosphate aminotransferase (isomerizing)